MLKHKFKSQINNKSIRGKKKHYNKKKNYYRKNIQRWIQRNTPSGVKERIPS
ncbi:hypothetical protein LRZ95_00240 [Candidatus Gracilibacteria bacterium]|nr:hypothetical protein [Candidatus Gracilibacteria bacterium]